MSNYTIIQNTTLELRRRIHAALASTPDTDFHLTNVEGDITLAPPPTVASGPPYLSLYLYHIELDSHLRNQEYLAVGPTGLRYPPLALHLNYLITPLEDRSEQNHLILGRVLQYFHDHPVIDAINGSALDNSFGGNSPEMRIAMETLPLEELSRIWHALTTPYQLSVAYIVRVVTIDSAQAEVEAKRVTELYTGVGIKN
jgi:uncharacterized protein DUF4255